MSLERALIDLANRNLDAENNWYQWSRGIDQTRLPKGISLPSGNNYAKNVALKLELQKHWGISNTNERLELAKYYVSTWGGVKRNKGETLLEYVTEEPDSIIRHGTKGVASWSKVLCIRDPNRYAIFDARVSTALNCLQIIGKAERPLLFPLLPGRNRRITAGMKKIKDYAARHDWSKARSLECYRDYLDLIRNVAESCRVPSTPIYAIEMLLFARAEELLLQAFPTRPVEK